MKLLYPFTRRWNMYWADHEGVEFDDDPELQKAKEAAAA
jgi:hypothetical protein